MAQLTDIEMLERNLTKAIRSQVRLKHSLAADRELNRKLAEVKREFEAAVKAGTVREFVTGEITAVASAV